MSSDNRSTINDQRFLVSIMGSYGEGNVGDEAVLDGIIQDIKAYRPDAHIAVFSRNPEETALQHAPVLAYPMLPAGVRSFVMQTAMTTLKDSTAILRESSDIIIGGGGIFYDTDFSTGRNPVKVWHTRCETIWKLRKSYQLYAVGVSRLIKDESKFMMKQIADNASAISVRDESSHKHLTEIGVSKPIRIVDDPALHLTAPKNAAANANPVIGISVRQWFLGDEARQAGFLQTLVALVAQLTEKLHAEVVLIPFSIGGDDDRALMQRLIINEHVHLSTQPHTVAGRMNEITRLDLIIGMRMHSLIFANLTKTPWIGLAYAEKVHEMAKKLRGENHLVDVNSFTAEKIVSLAEKLLN